MKESMWGYGIIVLGVLAIGVIWFFANVTRTDQHNFNLLKETVESAMIDSVDISAYRKDGTVKIIEQKFVANFIRRFAENADLSNKYRIEIFDINEAPPKVSLRVSSTNQTTTTGELVNFNVVNNIDAILESKFQKNDENYRCIIKEDRDGNGKLSVGDIYTCIVNDAETYEFFVLEDFGDKVNFIKTRNLHNSNVYYNERDSWFENWLKEENWDEEISTRFPELSDLNWMTDEESKTLKNETTLSITKNIPNDYSFLYNSLETPEPKSMRHDNYNKAYWIKEFTAADGWCIYEGELYGNGEKWASEPDCAVRPVITVKGNQIKDY